MPDLMVLFVLLGTSIWVIVTDLFYRRIHNVLVFFLLISWLLIALTTLLGVDLFPNISGSELPTYLLQTILVALAVLIVGFLLFLFGQMGAGDVKLLTVLCLWVGVDNQLAFLIVTALIGGGLALFIPVLTLIEIAGARFIQHLSDRFPLLNIPTPMVFSREGVKGMPYGVAISGGVLYLLITPYFR